MYIYFMDCPPLRGEPIIKKDGVDPFKHPVVRKWYDIFLYEWNSKKRYAILLPCTSKKPYYLSPTHKIAYATLRGYEDKVQFYSVSEPMLLVPREYEDCYPFNNYDYPPAKMTEEEREEFVELLGKALLRVSKMHDVIIAVLPKHHYNVVKRASENTGVKVQLHPYGRLAFRSISQTLKDLKRTINSS